MFNENCEISCETVDKSIFDSVSHWISSYIWFKSKARRRLNGAEGSFFNLILLHDCLLIVVLSLSLLYKQWKKTWNKKSMFSTKKKTCDAQLKFLFVYILHFFCVLRRGIINGLNNSWSHYEGIVRMDFSLTK